MTSYATVQDIANALELPPQLVSTDAVSAGAMQITVQPVAAANGGGPAFGSGSVVSINPGALLLIGYRGQFSETATALSVSDNTITLQDPLSISHGAGTILLDVTPFLNLSEAASRMVDDLTWTPANGWSYADQVVETHKVKVDRAGDLNFPLNLTPISAVQAISYQEMPFEDIYNIAPERAWWDDGSYILHIFTGRDVPSTPFCRAKVTVTYSGGYTPETMPGDIKRSVAMLAARLWKEKDSGFSDIIGNQEMGTFIYSKAAPPDVIAMLQVHKRVSV